MCLFFLISTKLFLNREKQIELVASTQQYSGIMPLKYSSWKLLDTKVRFSTRDVSIIICPSITLTFANTAHRNVVIFPLTQN